MIKGYRLVPPCGMKSSIGHANTGPDSSRHAWGEIQIPDYPPSPRGRALKNLRTRLGLTLREASRRLGLRVVEYSRLEYGAAVVDNWDEAERILRHGGGGESA